MSTRYLTVADVAEHLSVDEWSVRRLIRQRQLAAVNVSTGRRPAYRIDPVALQEFLASRQVAPLPRTRTA